jgi:hypothetical protein
LTNCVAAYIGKHPANKTENRHGPSHRIRLSIDLQNCHVSRTPES